MCFGRSATCVPINGYYHSVSQSSYFPNPISTQVPGATKNRHVALKFLEYIYAFQLLHIVDVLCTKLEHLQVFEKH